MIRPYLIPIVLPPAACYARDGLQRITTPRTNRHQWVDELADRIVLSDRTLMFRQEGILRDLRLVRQRHALDQTFVERCFAGIAPVDRGVIAIRVRPRLLVAGIVDDLWVAARLHVGVVDIVR